MSIFFSAAAAAAAAVATRISPPTIEELETRLLARGSEDEAGLKKRLALAVSGTMKATSEISRFCCVEHLYLKQCVYEFIC